MFKKLFKTNKKWLIVVGLLVGVVLTFSGMKTMAYLDSPGFCQNCHTMKSVYNTFMDSTHAELQCNDCHLPHKSEIGKLFFKGRAGMTHIYYNTFATDDIPNEIHATERTKAIMDDNCIRCHQSTVDNISHDAKDSCSSCHKTVPHGKGFKDDHFNEPPKSGELLENRGGF